MGRILLIKASDIRKYQDLMPSWILSLVEKSHFALVPPLGLMMIASVLRVRGHDVAILDMREIELKNKSLRAMIEKISPDVVGISAITTEAPSMHAIAAVVKQIDPRIPIIVGGPHASSFTRKVLTDPNILCAVLGEGEQTVLEVIETIGRKGNIQGIKGIAYSNGAETIFTPARPYIQDLDALPYPAWDLVDLNFYSRYRSMASVGLRKYMTLFTSRACPYHCSYCHNMFGKRFRVRRPENVIREMEILAREHGVEEFEILDDIFNLDLDRAHAVCDGLISKNLGIRFSFPNALRGDRLPSDLIRKLTRAGMNFTSIAVETASPRIQRLIKKNLNLGRVREAIKELHRCRVFTRGFFMLGFPTETREELLATIRFAVDSELPSAMFFIVTPFEGTEMYNFSGATTRTDSMKFTGYDYFHAPFNLSRVGDEELHRLQRYAVLRFNASPWRIWEIVSTFPRKRHLHVYALGVIKNFFIKREAPGPDGKTGGKPNGPSPTPSWGGNAGLPTSDSI